MNNWIKCAIAAGAALMEVPASAQEMPWLDKFDGLAYQTPNGFLRTELNGLADLEGYYADQPASGLLYFPDKWFFNPRLSLYLENQIGEHFYSMVQVRFDRGFDPGVDRNGDIRADEYFLRYTPFNDGSLNIQAGKFATLYGNFVPRHDSWHNPFITAPLMYENLVAISDRAAPGGRAGYLGWKNLPTPRLNWVPVIWGPSYALGGAVFGVLNNKYEYGFEVKHTGLASRPFAWDPMNVGFDHPNFTGRIGYKPNARWNVGGSASYGPYMLPTAAPSLPAGTGVEDYNQLTVGPDLSFAWRHFELFSEAYYATFDVPRVGQVDTSGYYVESKYKLDEHWFVGLRWNQQFFGKIENSFGGEERWDNNNYRIDSVVGYRFNRHLQAKLQYSFSKENGPIREGGQMVAAQLTLKF